MPRSRSRALAKQAQAVDLFAKGHTFQQIANRVGYAHRGTAHKVVMKALNSQIIEDIEYLRNEEYEALNMVLRQCWQVIRDEHTSVTEQLRAVSEAASIIEKKSKLMGLYCHRCNEADQLTIIFNKATQERQHSCCEHCPERRKAPEPVAATRSRDHRLPD